MILNEIDAYNRLNIIIKRYYLTFLFNIVQNESMKTIFSSMKFHEAVYKTTKKKLLKITKIEKKMFLRLLSNSCDDKSSSRNKKSKFIKKN